MIKIPVYNQEGKELESIALPNNIFGLKQNSGLLHLASQIYLGNQRKGTAKVKTRAERRGGGKKPWKQKGTGRARAGTTRSPLWRKGGRVFGPTGEQNYHRELPHKTRIKALLMSLSSKAQQQKIIGLNKIDFPKISARSFDQMLKKLPEMRSALFVLPVKDKVVILSARNVSTVTTRTYDNINIMDIMSHDFLVFLKDALPLVEKKWAEISLKGVMTDEEVDVAVKKNIEKAKAETTMRAQRQAEKQAKKKANQISAAPKKTTPKGGPVGSKAPKAAAKKVEVVKKETAGKSVKVKKSPVKAVASGDQPRPAP